MNSQLAELVGQQEPRVANAPTAKFSHADDAAFLSSSYGLTPDEWQFTVLEAWLGEQRNGKWSAGRCGLAVPRQNGKNGLLEMVELYKLVVLGRRILHTAHEVKTARKAFLRLCGFFENERQWPELAELVKEIRRTNGQEAVVLTNGASCEFVARSRGSARGYTVDDLMLDEAQELTDEQLEALLPTISSAPSGNPQVTMIGTPPGPNSPGQVFTRMRSAGVEGKDRRLSWHEWSVIGDVDVHDRSLWAQTNPSLGTRLHMSVIEDEVAQMSPDGFARERLGRWSEDAATGGIVTAAKWKALESDAPTDGETFYGIKFSPDGETMALSVALRPKDGPIHVEGVFHKPMYDGIRWLVDWLKAPTPGDAKERPRWSTCGAIVVDGKANAPAFVKALLTEGCKERQIKRPTTEDVVAAHSMWLQAIRNGEMTVIDDPAMLASVTGAGRRKIGNLGGWGLEPLTEDVDVTLAESGVLAHFGAATIKKRSGVVW